MAYTKTTWQNGDLITAQKLNKLEQGVAAISHLLFPVNVEASLNEFDSMVYTADKTYAEVCELIDSGRLPVYIIHRNDEEDTYAPSIEYHIIYGKWSSGISVTPSGPNYIVHDQSGVHTQVI